MGYPGGSKNERFAKDILQFWPLLGVAKHVGQIWGKGILIGSIFPGFPGSPGSFDPRIPGIPGSLDSRDFRDPRDPRILDFRDPGDPRILSRPSAQLSPAQLSLARLSPAQPSSAQLNSARFSPIQLSSLPFSPSFDLSNLPLDNWYFRLFPFYSRQFCPMLDWTGQNWTKRDIKL